MKKVFLTLLLLGAIPPVQVLANSFSGQATVVDATVLGVNTKLGNAGPLPPEGGSDESTLLTGGIPGVLSAEVFHAATVAMGDASRAEASVANLNVTVAGNTIGAGFLMSRAGAFCGPGGRRTPGARTFSS